MKSSRNEDRLFLLIIVAFCLYAAVFIFRTSFVVQGERYFSLQDDGMISMRYARNLAHGDGLVWNPGGERIEGYTNFLWVVYMAALHLLPLPASKISLLVQITGAGVLISTLFYVRKIAGMLFPKLPLASLGAVLLTAFFYPLVNWSLQGMEVSVAAWVITVCAWLGIKHLQAGTVSVPMYLILGAGTLLRPDMIIPYLVFWLFFVIVDRERRRIHLLMGAALLVGFVGGLTLFRLVYYGTALPNTYYLKMTGYPTLPRMTRGALVMIDFLIWSRLLFAGTLVYFLARRRTRLVQLLLTVSLVQMAYSIYVGGDAWEWWRGCNRYTSIVVPLLFVLMAGALGQWFQARQTFTHISGSVPTAPLVTPAMICVLGLCLLLTNGFNGKPSSLQRWMLLMPPPDVVGNQRMVEMAQSLKSLTDANATIAVTWAGGIPYYTDRPCIDILGKMDAVIAHEPMRVPTGQAKYTDFHPGHLKWDYAHSIGKLQPDVIAQIWVAHPEEAEPYLHARYRAVEVDGYCFYCRIGSQHVQWKRSASLSAISNRAQETGQQQ